jgi:carbon-monoxide dehydrogenase medium subunit
MPKAAAHSPKSASRSFRATDMKPAALAYHRATSIEDAVAALAAAGYDGKIIAGGQSLMPMMNFRLVRPAVLVDINHIPGIGTISLRGSRLAIGALVRHRMTASDETILRHAPILNAAMQHVAHLTVRNRGTFVGSLCHADPAAEMPMMAQLLNGTIHIAGTAGRRSLTADAFITGSLTNALEADEMVFEVELDTLPAGTGWGFHEFARRHGDYALAAIAVTLERAGGVARRVRFAAMGLDDRARRLPEVEAALEGNAPDAATTARILAALQAAIAPGDDLGAPADYRRHLATVLCRRALADAWARARESRPA